MGLKLLLLCGIFSQGVQAEPFAEFIPEIITTAVVRIDAPIKIDGQLNEPVWQRAEPITRFYEIRNPDQGGPVALPPSLVNVRVLADSEYLYIGAEIQDEDLVANPGSTDRSADALFLDGDVFEIFIQPDVSQTVYYEFHINPLNAVWNARYMARAGYMHWTRPGSWTSGIKTAVALQGSVNTLGGDQGWTLEAAIPLAAITDLQNRPSPTGTGNRWRFAVCLYDYQIGFDDANNSKALRLVSSAKLPEINFHLRGFWNYLEFTAESGSAE